MYKHYIYIYIQICFTARRNTALNASARGCCEPSRPATFPKVVVDMQILTDGVPTKTRDTSRYACVYIYIYIIRILWVLCMYDIIDILHIDRYIYIYVYYFIMNKYVQQINLHLFPTKICRSQVKLVSSKVQQGAAARSGSQRHFSRRRYRFLHLGYLRLSMVYTINQLDICTYVYIYIYIYMYTCIYIYT